MSLPLKLRTILKTSKSIKLINSRHNFSTSVTINQESNATPIPRYKLTYFNLRAIAEPIRFIFAYAKVPYQDNRISWKEWAAFKPSTPLGTMPILLIDDDKELTQSSTIARYLANKFDLVPRDEFHAARCDEVVDMLNDIVYLWRPFLRELDPVRKAQLKAELLAYLPQFLIRFENFVASNDNKRVAGELISWADLALASYLELFELTMKPNPLTNYPKLVLFKEHIFGLPQLEGWIKARPPFKTA